MTMTNAEWCIKNGIKFKKIDVEFITPKEVTICYKNNEIGRIDKADEINTVYRALIKWLDMEHKEPILDDAEKRYLRAVIRPFRGSICGIRKIARSSETEMIRIDMKDWDMAFRPFKKGTMYKRMEPNKKYTLEELGL